MRAVAEALVFALEVLPSSVRYLNLITWLAGFVPRAGLVRPSVRRAISLTLPASGRL